jgi:hypothetical protein
MSASGTIEMKHAHRGRLRVRCIVEFASIPLSRLLLPPNCPDLKKSATTVTQQTQPTFCHDDGPNASLAARDSSRQQLVSSHCIPSNRKSFKKVFAIAPEERSDHSLVWSQQCDWK